MRLKNSHITLIFAFLFFSQFSGCSTVEMRQKKCAGGDADSCGSLISDCDHLNVDACVAASQVALNNGQTNIDYFLTRACYGGALVNCHRVGIDPAPIQAAYQRQNMIQQQQNTNMINTLNMTSQWLNSRQPAAEPAHTNTTCTTRSYNSLVGGTYLQTDCN